MEGIAQTQELAAGVAGLLRIGFTANSDVERGVGSWPPVVVQEAQQVLSGGIEQQAACPVDVRLVLHGLQVVQQFG